ncbi:MAG: type II toxin-antitoxin system RelE/ParE family toxin [Hyphomicrobiales bacterium]|nr:MAG: type II toxin-antitoxin system RelE/ParE family toxin [Hyphomicrobiales bacterium]
MKRVLLSPKARAFLLSEAGYLRKHSPRAAERFLDRLREARRSLSRFDQLGFSQDALPLPGIRRLIMGDYMLDYFPGETIVIVAIRHGRQSEAVISSDEIEDFPEPDNPASKAD